MKTLGKMVIFGTCLLATILPIWHDWRDFLFGVFLGVLLFNGIYMVEYATVRELTEKFESIMRRLIEGGE